MRNILILLLCFLFACTEYERRGIVEYTYTDGTKERFTISFKCYDKEGFPGYPIYLEAGCTVSSSSGSGITLPKRCGVRAWKWIKY